MFKTSFFDGENLRRKTIPSEIFVVLFVWGFFTVKITLKEII